MNRITFSAIAGVVLLGSAYAAGWARGHDDRVNKNGPYSDNIQMGDYQGPINPDPSPIYTKS